MSVPSTPATRSAFAWLVDGLLVGVVGVGLASAALLVRFPGTAEAVLRWLAIAVLFAVPAALRLRTTPNGLAMGAGLALVGAASLFVALWYS